MYSRVYMHAVSRGQTLSSQALIDRRDYKRCASRFGTIHSTQKFGHLVSDNCVASHGDMRLQSKKKDGFLHISKESNGAYAYRIAGIY